MANTQSEIAQLRQKIEQELEAMQRGLSGMAMGMARHNFIFTRMEHVGVYQDRLAGHVGEEVANKVVCALYMKSMGEEVPDDLAVLP